MCKVCNIINKLYLHACAFLVNIYLQHQSVLLSDTWVWMTHCCFREKVIKSYLHYYMQEGIVVVIIKTNVLWIYQGRRAEIDLQLKKDHIGREEAESKQKKAWLWSVLNGDVLSLIQEYFSDVFKQIWFKYISESTNSSQLPCFIYKWWITSNLQHLIYANEIRTRCLFISLLKEIYNGYYCVDYLRVDLARKTGRLFVAFLN